ncbi:MAG TPA: DNA recombination protein RmuC [Candidatus Saccharimonadales bacterium]|nr:DNA recombination protein RmuC [Candidatus Saccharimonadales bacterium]
MPILTAILAFIFGACITAIIFNGRSSALRVQSASLETELAAGRTSLEAAQVQLNKVTSELKVNTEARYAAELEAGRRGEQIKQQEVQFSERLKQQEQQFEQQLDTERQQSREKLELLTSARVELSNQFKTLANDILEEKTKRFTEQNQVNLSQLLTPLATQIKGFQQKVEEVYVQEGKDRSALSEQVKMLMGLNKQLSDDTGRLTRALTTSSKAQGDLGEMILEKILESSGLRKDEEYFVQNSFRNEDSRQVRPDVIVKLPEEKHLIVDSKVSLTAYNDFVNAESEDARKLALTRHMESIRRHIKELAEKNYQSLHQLQSIDFVCMFIPIEGAFMAAINNDSELWGSSYERNVLMVSPSTLLFVVRTVAHLWRQERQKQNVQDIVKRGAELHDKLVGFVDDLKSVGDRLEQARSSYNEAFSKLSTGKGNVIRQAVMLRELGVKPKKNLPVDMVEASAEEEPLLAEHADAVSTS